MELLFPPTRLPGDIYEAAQQAAASASRSTAQQIAHWARIGRELESSPSINARDIQRVLAGESPYSSLNDHEQAVVRAEWDERIATGISELNFEAEFADEDGTWAVGDGTGNAVLRPTTDS